MSRKQINTATGGTDVDMFTAHAEPMPVPQQEDQDPGPGAPSNNPAPGGPLHAPHSSAMIVALESELLALQTAKHEAPNLDDIAHMLERMQYAQNFWKGMLEEVTTANSSAIKDVRADHDKVIALRKSAQESAAAFTIMKDLHDDLAAQKGVWVAAAEELADALHQVKVLKLRLKGAGIAPTDGDTATQNPATSTRRRAKKPAVPSYVDREPTEGGDTI